MSVENSCEQPSIKNGSPELDSRQVDESWALKLLEECERELEDEIFIHIETQASNDDSAIQNQLKEHSRKKQLEREKEYQNGSTAPSFRSAIKKIFPIFPTV